MRYPLNIIPKPNSAKDEDGIFIIPTHLNAEDYVVRCVDPRIENEEGYVLTVRPNGITVRGGSKKGIFYGMQTVRQLLATNKLSIPCVTIQDSPAYPHRAFMIDCARHIVSVENLKKMIDAAALFKMNVFHWHLTDDQGWRFESRKFPLLNTISAYRNSSDFDVHVAGRYGGVYTQEEMREIVKYCEERCITVVPEFDLPGHSRALLAAYPEFSCRGKALPVETRAGIFDDILCAGKEETFEMVFSLLDEIMQVFPGEFIHIGGDEAPKTRWVTCPKCRKRIQDEHLKTAEELQQYFMNRILKYLRDKGRRAIVWNEATHGGRLHPSAIVQLWENNENDGAHWANSGGRVIFSDSAYYYCSRPYTVTPLKKTYEYEPGHLDVKPERRKYIRGVEAAVWTERIRDFKRLSYMCFPRFAAVAETGWTKPENKDERTFETRFVSLTPLVKSTGVIPAPPSEWNPPLKRIFRDRLFYSNKRRPIPIVLDEE